LNVPPAQEVSSSGWAKTPRMPRRVGVMMRSSRLATTALVTAQRPSGMWLVPCHGLTRRLVPGAGPDGCCHNRRIGHKGPPNTSKDRGQAAATQRGGHRTACRQNHSIEHKGNHNSSKDSEQAAAKPAAGDPAPAGGYHEPDHTGPEWPEKPSGAPRGQGESQARAERAGG